MTYEPLPDYLTIKKSPIAGLGLFATKDIPVGTNLGESHIERETELIRTPLGGFYNHSDVPNCMKEELVTFTPRFKRYFLRAMRNIKSGEEITVFYTFYKV